jgi:glyoxylase-like metal-dependent hydrolase (beta-lactamase superfamily II)/rhodanese-related sulfurtransferase
MIFRQILYRDLGCASYLLADGGQAVVVDPRFDAEAYVELAAEDDVKIAHVLDTHMHADHVSGRERLAELTGARAYTPAGASSDAAPNGSGPLELAAGDTITVGRLRLEAWATPGHRPEHLAIVVTDLSRGEDPWLVLSGDSLLVGDLARPDLAVEPRDGARELHTTLREILDLGDHVELWPGHVGGSLCGGAGLSGKTSSTIGYERHHNRLLSLDRTRFVEELVRELPPRPPNIARIVELNRARAHSAPPPVPVLDEDALICEIVAGAQVIDGRPPAIFDAGHLPGSINLPAGRSQGTRAGWVLEPDERLVVIGTDREHARSVASGLHAVGLWGVVGLAAGEPERWKDAGLEVQSSSSWDVATLAEKLRAQETQLVDVREPDEWASGHVDGSYSLPLNRLHGPDAIVLEGVSGSLAVACAGGMRAAFAASVIRRRVHSEVIRVAGGGIGHLPSHEIPLASG